MTYRLALGAIGVVADICALRRPVILCLHSVVPEQSTNFASAMSITDRFLDRLIVDLRRRHIPILSLSEAMARLQSSRFSPFVCFTFDDGYRDVYENARPVFQRHDAPFAVFVTTGLIDGNVPMWWHVLERAIAKNNSIRWSDGAADLSNPQQKRAAFQILKRRFRTSDADGNRAFIHELASLNPYFSADDAYGCAMTWEMVRDMISSGRVEFGSHTVTHPLLSRLELPDLEREIGGSREKLEANTGVECRFFAFPYGQLTEVGAHAPSVVRDAGFCASFTTEARVMTAATTKSYFILPRILLSRKAQSPAVVRGYMSGIPAALRRIRPRVDRDADHEMSA